MMIELIVKEFVKFSKENWWIYIFFLICLFIIAFTHSGSVIEVSLVFVAHFLADLFIMVMSDFYAKAVENPSKKQEYEKKAIYAQTITFVIFSLIGLYAAIFWGKWSYIIPQILFVWPLVKGYLKIYAFDKCANFFDFKFMILVSVLVIFFYFYLGLVSNFGVFIQILGFCIFPLALLLNNEKLRYWISVLGIGFIVIGSAWQLYLGFLQHQVLGVEVSYTLLPFVVFVFYLKNWRKFL